MIYTIPEGDLFITLDSATGRASYPDGSSRPLSAQEAALCVETERLRAAGDATPTVPLDSRVEAVESQVADLDAIIVAVLS